MRAKHGIAKMFIVGGVAFVNRAVLDRGWTEHVLFIAVFILANALLDLAYFGKDAV